MSSLNTDNFEAWIRNDFREINTQLENLYFAQDCRENVAGIGEQLKRQLRDQGGDFIKELLKEGNTDEGFDNGFSLLGNVGFFMAACRRHEVSSSDSDASSPLNQASALAMQLGASLGVIPRFASSHLETHNLAINGQFKTFTDLADESLFIDYNSRGVFAFMRAADALLRILPLGISHPVSAMLFNDARNALHDVISNNASLFKELDAERFFYSVRPYYKPHKVGLREYRGANAGDFAGINVVDLLLGLCHADDPYYSQILVDKFLYMRPEDQLTLRDCMRRRSLLDAFLDVPHSEKQQPWFQTNLAAFLEVCELHGKTAIQHHDMLVKKFIEKPTAAANLTDKSDLTASGPPLPVLLKSLKHLCDLRTAANVDGIRTRYADIRLLKQCLSDNKGTNS